MPSLSSFSPNLRESSPIGDSLPRPNSSPPSEKLPPPSASRHPTFDPGGGCSRVAFDSLPSEDPAARRGPSVVPPSQPSAVGKGAFFSSNGVREKGWQVVSRRRHSKRGFSTGKQGSNLSSGNTNGDRSAVRRSKLSFGSGSSPKSWADIVNPKSADDDLGLSYYPEALVDKKVRILNSDFAESDLLWKNSLMVYAIGRRPYYMHFAEFLRKQWKPVGEMKIYSRENGFFLCQFAENDDFVKVLAGGPYLFEGRLLVVKKFSSEISLDRDLLAKVPVWVRLPGLCLKLWNAVSIGKLVSAIGRPLQLDALTAKRERLSFARVFVELSADADRIHTIPVIFEDGSTYDQPVEYEYLPPVCENCHCFGHSSSLCSVGMKKVWVPKKSQIGDSGVVEVDGIIAGDETVMEVAEDTYEGEELNIPVGRDTNEGVVSGAVEEPGICLGKALKNVNSELDGGAPLGVEDVVQANGVVLDNDIMGHGDGVLEDGEILPSDDCLLDEDEADEDFEQEEEGEDLQALPCEGAAGSAAIPVMGTSNFHMGWNAESEMLEQIIGEKFPKLIAENFIVAMDDPVPRAGSMDSSLLVDAVCAPEGTEDSVPSVVVCAPTSKGDSTGATSVGYLSPLVEHAFEKTGYSPSSRAPRGRSMSASNSNRVLRSHRR